MSQFAEYVSLFLKGLPHSKEIADSIIKGVQMKYGTLPEDEKEEIIRRRMICASCPLMSKNATTSQEYFSLKGEHYPLKKRADHCAMCGCGIDMRTRSLNSDCGLYSWNEDNPTKQQPLKWTKYGKDKENSTVEPDRNSTGDVSQGS